MVRNFEESFISLYKLAMMTFKYDKWLYWHCYSHLLKVESYDMISILCAIKS